MKRRHEGFCFGISTSFPASWRHSSGEYFMRKQTLSIIVLGATIAVMLTALLLWRDIAGSDLFARVQNVVRPQNKCPPQPYMLMFTGPVTEKDKERVLQLLGVNNADQGMVVCRGATGWASRAQRDGAHG